MAEAVVNRRMGEDWQAFSAGVTPEGRVNPRALAVLEEIGIQHQGRSKHVDEFQDREFDLVVTVCDDAAENCPVWLGKGVKVHHSFRDPAKAQGSDEEVMQVFRDVLAKIQREIPELLDQIKHEF